MRPGLGLPAEVDNQPRCFTRIMGAQRPPTREEHTEMDQRALQCLALHTDRLQIASGLPRARALRGAGLWAMADACLNTRPSMIELAKSRSVFRLHRELILHQVVPQIKPAHLDIDSGEFAERRDHAAGILTIVGDDSHCGFARHPSHAA